MMRPQDRARKEYPLFECDADAWTLETYNDKILGIGRYYEGEKLLAFFNFSEEDETAWINEEENYIDLVTGQPRAAKAVGVPAHDFVWLYYNFNPKPEVKVEEVKVEEPAAPAEEVKAEEPAAPVEEVKAEEPAAPVEEAPKKTTRKRTTKKAAAPAADAAAEEAPKKTTKKRTTKKAAAADAPAAEEAPKKTTRKRTTKKAAAADAPAAEEAPKKTTRKRATKKAAEAEE